MAGQNLTKAKSDFKKIEQFCRKRPSPNEGELNQFLIENSLEKYQRFAKSFFDATTEKNYILYLNKVNRYRD